MDTIIIVDDGQHRWGANEAELLAALEVGGWTMEGPWNGGRSRQYVEPEMTEAERERNEPTAYTDLCERVGSVMGEGSDVPLDQDDERVVGKMYFDEPESGSRGRHVWGFHRWGLDA